MSSGGGGDDTTRVVTVDPAASAPPRRLKEGERILDRYRVVRLIAEGGMGEVYEVRDDSLHEDVALKIIRADVKDDPASAERFRREIQLARRVTNPHVCRVFESGTHEGLPFLTMELLDGETLAARLHRAPPLGAAEIRRIAEHMALGLAAAHEAGVVHRDFKPANVLLRGDRAVVTDFGVARQLVARDMELTGAGDLVGTPAYMAPEQLKHGGAAVTAASDVYALGLVLYEMITGERPHHAETPVEMAIERAAAVPVPRRRVPGVDAALERIILRCLEPDPADRFPDAGHVVRALAGEAAVAPARAQRRRRRRIAVSVAAVAVIAGAALWVRARTRAVPATRGHAGAAEPSDAPGDKQVFAILGFKNLTGRPDAAWMRTAFAEMLTSDLTGIDGVRVLPGETVAHIKAELALDDADGYAPDTLARLRRRAGLDRIVVGSYLRLPNGKVRLDVRIQDVATGEFVASVAEEGTEETLLDVVTRAGARLRRSLGAPAAPPEADRAEMFGKNTEAARLYAEGLEHMRRDECAAAEPGLRRAVAVDPEFVKARALFANVLNCLGRQPEASEQARLAVKRAPALGKQDRLLVEAWQAQIDDDMVTAIERWKSLYALDPDNVMYGLNAARYLGRIGKFAEAKRMVEEVRRSVGARYADDPEIDIVDARFTGRDAKTVMPLLDVALAKAKQQGAKTIVAAISIERADTLNALGEFDKMEAAGEEARELLAQVGDPDGMVLADYEIALSHYRRWHMAAARRFFQRAVDACRRMENVHRIDLMVTSLADTLYELGDLDGARRMIEEALTPEMRAKRPVWAALSRWGRTLVAMGRVAEGKAAIVAQVKALETNATLGYVKLIRREWTEAMVASGDLAAAKQYQQEQLDACAARKDASCVAKQRVALADLALEEERWADAEALAAQAAEQLDQDQVGRFQIGALLVRARAAWALGRPADAAAFAARARALAPGSDSVHLELVLLHAEGRFADALALATRHGFARRALLARLELARAQGASGAADARAAAREARGLGYALVAAHAEALAAELARRR